LVYKYFGLQGLGYLFFSLWFGYGLHPAAMHFIQEHYTYKDGQETYSYYGNWNPFFLNIGYHNEHHDFTKVPWSKLPEVKKRANEFYEPLASHDSWIHVLTSFILDPQLGPQSRVGRSHEDHKKGRKMVVEAKRKLEELKRNPKDLASKDSQEAALKKSDSGFQGSLDLENMDELSDEKTQ
jgi:sphingolipid delta-4 desaturase